MFFLVDDHGESLGKFAERDAALAAFEAFREDEPLAECAVVEVDASGNRVGDPVTHAYH
jgi:hypothetical protein